MTSFGRTGLRVPSVALRLLILILILVQARAGRPDRGGGGGGGVLASEEYVSATVNATATDARGHAVHVMSSEDGTYGQNSPKVDTRALVVVTPAPRHGGEPRTQAAHTQTKVEERANAD